MFVVPGPTLQWFLWRWGERHPGPRMGYRPAVVEAAREIARCGNGGLGWRVYTCPQHGQEYRPNACRRRDCPHCISDRAFKWCCVIERRLLGCDHFHVVFTLSSILNPYWRHNRTAMANLLFEAAANALKRLLREPGNMGGTPAMLAVLHTHGGALVLHPHVHFVVSSAGLSPDGKLVRARRPKTLLPYKVLRRLFQLEFLDGLSRLGDRKDFHFPTGTTAPQFRALVSDLFAQPQSAWNARIFHRHDVRPVIRYLSRTVYGGPIRNDRIRLVTDDEIQFRYQDWRHREEGSDQAPPFTICRLSHDEFFDRWSDHIHESGFKSVRYFGLFAPGNRDHLETARKALEQEPLPPERDADDPPPEPAVCCRQCQRPMTFVELPPTQPLLSAAAKCIIRTRAGPFFRSDIAA